MARLKDFPSERLIELFVDGALLNSEKSWRDYENREPGCITQMFKAYAFAVNHIDKPISVDLIKEIYKIVTENVSGVIQHNAITASGQFRDAETSTYFKVSKSRMTRAGLAEFLARERNEHHTTKSLMIDNEDLLHGDGLRYSADEIYERLRGHEGLLYCAGKGHNIEKSLGEILTRYGDEIKLASTLDQEIEVIAKHIQLCELLHPFPDANGRVFANVILFMMLVQNNLMPSILYQPNIFDLYGVKDIANVIKEGMLFFEYIVANPENELFYNPKNIAPSEHEKIESASRCLRDAIFDMDDIQLKSSSEWSPPWSGRLSMHLDVVCGYNNVVQMRSCDINHFLNERVAEETSPLLNNKYPIHLAAKFNRTPLIAWMIGFDPEQVHKIDSNGNTPLHYAAQFGDALLVEFLLKQNATIRQENNDHVSPLALAARTGDLKTFKLLYNHSASIQYQDDQFIIEMIACLSGAMLNGNLPVFDFLLTMIQENYLLHHAINEYLKEIKAIKNTLTMSLHLLIRQGHSAILRHLLETDNSLLRFTLNDGALQAAIENNRPECYLMLLRHGVVPSQETLGMLMRTKNNAELILETFKLDAITANCINADLDMMKPLVSNYPDRTDILELLLQKGLTLIVNNEAVGHLTLVADFVNRSGYAYLNYLNEHGYLTSDVLNYQDEHNYTALAYAVFGGHCDIAELLLKAGADPAFVNISGESLFYIAYQNEDMLRLLIRKISPALTPALLNIVNDDGHTPLSRAIDAGSLSVVRLLLKHGADPTIIPKNNMSVIEQIAKNGGDLRMLQLVVLSIPPSRRVEILNDGYHESPLLTAINNYNFEMADYLCSHGASLDIKGKGDRIMRSYLDERAVNSPREIKIAIKFLLNKYPKKEVLYSKNNNLFAASSSASPKPKCEPKHVVYTKTL